MRNKAYVCSTAALLAVAGLAEAQIEVDGWKSFNSESGTFSSTFDARVSDKLVIIATGEHGFNNTSGDLLDIKYDGVSLTKAIERQPQVAQTDTIYADIWYLDDPRSIYSAGVIDVFSVTRANITVIGLSGTLEGVGNVGVTPTDTRSINLATSAGSFVVASFSMGGAGNTANVLDVTPNAPLTKIAALENGSNWDGQVVGYHNYTPAGTQTYSFTGGNTDGSLVIAAEFLLGPPPPLLTLRVNTLTGGLTLLGDPGDAVTMNYYEITSAAGTLDASGWNSLADQDYEGNGPANSTGNGWEEAGGSNAGAMAEAYLLGDSVFEAGSAVDLGLAYDTGIDAQDLVFRYRTDLGKIFFGTVEYYESIFGDLNDDLAVDALDLAIVLGRFGSSVDAGSLADGDLTGDGRVDASDLNLVLSAWTSSTPPSLVPEPGSLGALAVTLGLVLRRRRRD